MSYAAAVDVRPGDVARPLWRALRDAQTPATVAELHAASAAHPNAIQLRLKRWERAGLVIAVEPQPLCFLATGSPKRPSRTWAAFARHAEPVSAPIVAAEAGVHPQVALKLLRRWERHGVAISFPAAVRAYRMADSNAAPPRAVNSKGKVTRALTGRQRIWNAMRVLKRFDLPTLMMASEQSRRSIEDYLNVLCRAGYARRVSRGSSVQGTWSLYQLIQRSGPIAPSVTHTRGEDGRLRRYLFDRNDGSRHDVSPGAVSLTRCVRTARSVCVG